MTRARQPRFESLETRALLSAIHHVAPRARHSVAAATLVLSGTLRVDNNAAKTSSDPQGDTLTTTPVSGQLGALGKVRGVWSTAQDQFGSYVGPDTLKIRTSNGTFMVQFSEQNVTARQHLPGGIVADTSPQVASQGTGAFAGAREHGTITLTTNRAHTIVETMTFSSNR